MQQANPDPLARTKSFAFPWAPALPGFEGVAYLSPSSTRICNARNARCDVPSRLTSLYIIDLGGSGYMKLAGSQNP